MKKAIIIYHSETDTTKRFSSEIADICNENNVDA
jgi:flavodoxin